MLDAEETVVAWLTGIVPSDWSVSADKLKSDPDHYILVERTGGPREDLVLDRAEILIETYSKVSRLEAKNMAMTISDQVKDMVFVADNLTRAQVNSITSLTDPATQTWRYQVYCDVWCRR